MAPRTPLLDRYDAEEARNSWRPSAVTASEMENDTCCNPEAACRCFGVCQGARPARSTRVDGSSTTRVEA